MNRVSVSAANHFLQEHPLFAPLAEPEQDTLKQNSRCYHLAEAKHLCRENEPSKGLWLIEDGIAEKVQFTQDGCQHILNLLMSGDVVNIVSAVQNCCEVTTVIAVIPVTAWLIPRNVIQELLIKSHPFALTLIDYMACKQKQRISYIKDLTLRSSTARVASFLLRQPDDFNKLPRTIIASHLNMTPETLSRSLRLLKEAEILRGDRQSLKVLNPKKLAAVANFSSSDLI